MKFLSFALLILAGMFTASTLVAAELASERVADINWDRIALFDQNGDFFDCPPIPSDCVEIKIVPVNK